VRSAKMPVRGHLMFNRPHGQILSLSASGALPATTGAGAFEVGAVSRDGKPGVQTPGADVANGLAPTGRQWRATGCNRGRVSVVPLGLGRGTGSVPRGWRFWLLTVAPLGLRWKAVAVPAAFRWAGGLSFKVAKREP
jgi:hypothetical protein